MIGLRVWQKIMRAKQYTDEIGRYSDQALLYDSKSDICLTSRALYYIENNEYKYCPYGICNSNYGKYLFFIEYAFVN